MFRKIHKLLAAACGIPVMMLCSCQNDSPKDVNDGGVLVTFQTRSPRAVDADGSTLNEDLTIHEGMILVYNEKGIYEGGDKIDPASKQVALRLPAGKKRIVAVANPSEAMRNVIAEYKREPIRDELGNVKTYKGDTIWTNIKPKHSEYNTLAGALSLSKDYLDKVQQSRRKFMVYDSIVNLDNEDVTVTTYKELRMIAPIARVDLHARVLVNEQENDKNRVQDAAIRVSNTSASLKWDLSRPDTKTDTVIASFKGISDKMTIATTRDEIFGDWVMENVKEDSPIASLYTYHTGVQAKLEIGLRFEGGADYDWYEIDMAELLGESYKGLEAGHLYQLFITIYPDRLGKIIVDAWIPSNLDFTIG